MIFDDQTVRQFDEYSDEDVQSVVDGYLDIIQFEGGKFLRLVAQNGFTVWEPV